MWRKDWCLAYAFCSRFKAHLFLCQFQERYEELNKESTSEIRSPKKKTKLDHLLRELDTDSDNSGDVSDDDADDQDPKKPWLVEFHRFLKVEHVLAEGMTVVQWWGVRICTSFTEFRITYYAQEYGHRYPTWASLARDYLAVMASSVSSERAFSAAGITISKRRDRLKGDIVEALQCLKCLYHQDLIFREVITCSEEEDVLDEALPEILDSSDGFAWDQILLDDEDLD